MVKTPLVSMFPKGATDGTERWCPDCCGTRKALFQLGDVAIYHRGQKALWRLTHDNGHSQILPGDTQLKLSSLSIRDSIMMNVRLAFLTLCLPFLILFRVDIHSPEEMTLLPSLYPDVFQRHNTVQARRCSPDHALLAIVPMANSYVRKDIHAIGLHRPSSHWLTSNVGGRASQQGRGRRGYPRHHRQAVRWFGQPRGRQPVRELWGR